MSTPFLAELLEVPPYDRLTGIRLSRPEPAYTDAGGALTLDLLSLPEDHEADVDGSLVDRFLPYGLGGFHGRADDGSEWIVIAQYGPPKDQGFGAVRSTQPWGRREASAPEPGLETRWSLARALRLAGVPRFPRATVALDRRSLVEPFPDPDVVADWSVDQLYRALLAELCGMPLDVIVQLTPLGCGFPNDAHECQGDVTRDVFSRWSAPRA
ncbi:hypothetical protein [Isoptericola variabilis]|uniref:Uncharacterized protein n=1 Tax=Isoptericola variabilis (strain 225) TaxID=743718 RepID=F6FPE9_ISOV2|nr:hypothetical protein [Isoptericola variabilis]AEG43662.1 hypothetical protein Isova_0878 [Isoptericola variabilis 225]TWH27343.1 hypothetical protein L600_000500000160 [Isoptericola variabilis J7]